MLPKEHGAYGQLVFPLLTSLVVVGPAYASLCLATATISVPFSHHHARWAPAARARGPR